MMSECNPQTEIRRDGTLKGLLLAATLAAHPTLATWSASGTVASTSGTALSGVAVSVQDTATISTTTSSTGAFSIGTSTSVLAREANDFPVEFAAGDLILRDWSAGPVRIDLVDGSGRELWSVSAVAVSGDVHLRGPANLHPGAAFLRVRGSGIELVQAVTTGPEGLRSAPHVPVASRALATYPVLVFRKTGYHDTTYAMTASTASGIAVKMRDTTTTVCQLPTTLKWQSSGILVSPKTDSKHTTVYAVKDPTIQRYNGNWLVYATVALPNGTGGATWSFEFTKFSDFTTASASTPTYMDQISGFSGYKCAPELFYMSTQNKWYILSQPGPWYSTTTTPDVPTSWSAPQTLYNMPSGQANIDFFPICDSKNCFLFFTGDNGKLYHTSTSLANFPTGWISTVTTDLSYGTNVLFEGSSHYKLKGLNKYLTLIEGMGSRGRTYSAWLADTLAGPWTEWKVGDSNPFASALNVTYASGVADWTNDVSHGEMIRDNPDQTQTVDPCAFQLFYQGTDPSVSVSDYGLIPYRLGLLTAQ
jgi:hypothetical protein